MAEKARSYIDEQGRVAWIYDEYTHPRGLFYNKKPVEPVKVEIVVPKAPVPEPVKKVLASSKKLKK